MQAAASQTPRWIVERDPRTRNTDSGGTLGIHCSRPCPSYPPCLPPPTAANIAVGICEPPFFSFRSSATAPSRSSPWVNLYSSATHGVRDAKTRRRLARGDSKCRSRHEMLCRVPRATCTPRRTHGSHFIARPATSGRGLGGTRGEEGGVLLSLSPPTRAPVVTHGVGSRKSG